MVKKEKNQKKREEGITLIALVITIIILLILAGVTIATLSGPNGILNNALNAKTKTEIANLEEEANIIYTELLANKYTEGGEDPSLGDLINKLTEKGYNIVTRPASSSSIAGINLSSTQLHYPQMKQQK